jgi:hypothetical protein
LEDKRDKFTKLERRKQMAMFYALGSAFLTEKEFHSPQTRKSIKDFTKALRKDPRAATLEFPTGLVTADNIVETVELQTGKVVPFEPIGVGKPLVIEIRHIYTGKFPEAGLNPFDKKKDMLVTSAMRSIATFNAAPRAINFLVKKIPPKYNIKYASASEGGTSLICYTPALIEENSVLTIEIGFDEFPDEFFTAVSKALTQAAGVPIFITASTYLLAAGIIAKLVGKVSKALFDKPSVFKATVPVTFEHPGDYISQADFRIITDDNADRCLVKSLLKEYHVGQGGQLVDDNGNPYEGDLPYVVISLDGGEYAGYAGFTATAASAALLEQFYSIEDKKPQPLDMLVEAVELYNDWEFRKQADGLSKKLKGKGIDKKSDNYRKKKAQYDALVANIINENLKPKAVS